MSEDYNELLAQDVEYVAWAAEMDAVDEDEAFLKWAEMETERAGYSIWV